MQENQINSFFTIGNHEEKELTEYLAEPHLQGGRIYVSITENTAEEIVTQIFNFTYAFMRNIRAKTGSISLALPYAHTSCQRGSDAFARGWHRITVPAGV